MGGSFFVLSGMPCPHSFSCGLLTDGVGFDSILHWKYESLSHFSILGNKLAFRIADSVLGQKFL